MNILLKTVSKFSSRNCWHCMPDDFFTVILHVQAVFIWFDFRFPQHITVTWWHTEWKSRPKRMKNNSATKNITQGGYWITECMGYSTACWKKPYSFASSLKFRRKKKNVQKFVQCTFLNCIPREDAVKFFFLYSQHTILSLMSDNRNVCITVELPANFICYF